MNNILIQEHNLHNLISLIINKAIKGNFLRFGMEYGSLGETSGLFRIASLTSIACETFGFSVIKVFLALIKKI